MRCPEGGWKPELRAEPVSELIAHMKKEFLVYFLVYFSQYRSIAFLRRFKPGDVSTVAARSDLARTFQ